MRSTQCSILYRYITDVHENRTSFIEQKTERIDFRLAKNSVLGLSSDLQCLGLSTDLKMVSFYLLLWVTL